MIEELWPTTYATATLPKDEVAPGTNWRDLGPAEVAQGSELRSTIVERLAATLLNAVPAVAAESEARVRYRFSVLEKGSYAGIQYSGGQSALLWVALLDGPPSGEVVLHDPRAGAAMVAMPGMPWGGGRPVRMSDGLALVLPGWLGWSVPVTGPDTRYLTACVSID